MASKHLKTYSALKLLGKKNHKIFKIQKYITFYPLVWN